MHPLLNIATRAARDAGNIILRSSENIDKINIETKSANDFVSEVDRAAEQAIIEAVHKAYPEHAILGEESGKIGDNDITWIIDPLDGTTNFLKGIPHYCVSIAVMNQGKIEHGVIYDPVRQDLFTASRGQGAALNGRRLRVTQAKSLENTILATGFPFKARQHHESYFAVLSDVFKTCGDIRRGGSAALDLAYTAAGKVDGYWEIGIKLWDIAAGALMVQEAGGLVGDFSGSHDYLQKGNIVAANPKVFKALVQKVHSSFG